MGKEEITGLINFKRVDKVAIITASGTEVVTILGIYLSSGNNLLMTLGATTILIPLMTLITKGIEMTNRAAARFRF